MFKFFELLGNAVSAGELRFAYWEAAKKNCT